MTKQEAIARIVDHMIVHEMNEPRAIHISEALNMAIKALEQTNWIPCSEPPKESGHYLVTHGGIHLIGVDFYNTEEDARRDFEENYEEYTGWSSGSVVAWMPLPKPYKENNYES